MIEFIICEDNEEFTNRYKYIIEKVMMNYDIEYNFNAFNGYSKKWEKISKKDNFKVYILDLKTDEGSGIDAARYIREELDDWQSMIIIVTAYPEYRYEALCKRLMLVDFVNKLDGFEQRFSQAIQISLKNYDKRPNSLKYTYKKVVYNVEFHKIIYIEKEQDSKRCIIKTIEREYYIQGNLSKILSLLDDRFIKCNRSYIINLEQVDSYDIKSNVIMFKNGEKLYAVSRDKRKEVLNSVRGIH
ncbi:MAG: response regulator transcription factor [Bacilli bacterium]|nr:response regulator transcription factor [Bacilli bacterium]